MDLGKLTYLELLELRKNVGDALSDYNNRNKHLVYCIKNDDDTTRYIEFDNAVHYLKFLTENISEYLFEGETVLTTQYINDAELKFCIDYKNKNE